MRTNLRRAAFAALVLAALALVAAPAVPRVAGELPRLAGRWRLAAMRVSTRAAVHLDGGGFPGGPPPGEMGGPPPGGMDGPPPGDMGGPPPGGAPAEGGPPLEAALLSDSLPDPLLVAFEHEALVLADSAGTPVRRAGIGAGGARHAPDTLAHAHWAGRTLELDRRDPRGARVHETLALHAGSSELELRTETTLPGAGTRTVRRLYRREDAGAK